MAERKLNRLGFKECEAAKEPGMYADGGGLYLKISTGGGKSWIYRFKWFGQRSDLGLGSYADLSLKAARGEAQAARDMIKSGRNPIAEKRAAEIAPAEPADGAAVPMFGPFARGLVKTWVDEFKSVSHVRSWHKTFGDASGEIKHPYAEAILHRPVDDIDTAAILSVLKPILKKSVTASRVRGRIERVLDAAKVLGHRSGDNPARWGGHLEVILKKPKKLTRGHHKAMPFDDMPAFMADLRKVAAVRMAGGKRGGGHAAETVTESVSSLALEFTILTAARTSETLLAPWSEISLHRKVWTVPEGRMKEGRIHRVPLCDRGIEILQKMRPFMKGRDSYIFRGQSGDGHLSNMAMAMCLRGLSDERFTVHGFRSTFTDWVGEKTDFPAEVRQAALAHKVGDDAELAYRRGDALERRQKLMQAWEDYLAGREFAVGLIA